MLWRYDHTAVLELYGRFVDYSDVAAHENENASRPRRMCGLGPAHGCLGFELPGGHCSVQDKAYKNK